MMLDQVKITLAGFERLVPRALLKAYQSFGWKESGADPVEVKTGETKPRQTSKKKKETKNVEVPKE